MEKVESVDVFLRRKERIEAEAKIDALEEILDFVASNPGWDTDVRDEIALYIEEEICDQRALVKLIAESNG